MKNFYIGRQPILDKNNSIYAYELLFRDSTQNAANFKDARYAISRTILNAIDKFGIDTILNNAKGFINVNEEFLMGDFIEILDKKRFVFEILETSNVDNNLISRVLELKKRGYHFALDDFIFTEGYIKTFKPFFEIVDIIKVDIRGSTKYDLIKKTRNLKTLNAKLLAEKVETYDEFVFTRDLGYELFQGYYFEKPTIMLKQGHSSNRAIIFKIINAINNNARTSEIANFFELEPNLTISLLKFINSAAFYFRTTINSITHAINLIGLIKLQNWLLLMSYAEGESPSSSPLFHAAIIRGKILEYLLEKISNDQKITDKGFLVGVLSLSDAIYKTPLQDILKDLNVDDDIKTAILEKEGLMGKLLQLTEYDEKNKYEKFLGLSIELKIDEMLFNDAKLSSYMWLNNLLKSI